MSIRKSKYANLKYRAIVYAAMFIICLLMLTGCPAISTIKNAETLSEGLPVVYGNVSLFKRDRLKNYNPYFVILTPEPDVIKAYEISNKDTTPKPFYWSLKPGKYTLLKVLFSQEPNRTKEIMLRSSFTVPELTQSVYIGDLLWDEEKSRLLLHDNYQEAVNALRANFSNDDMTSTKSLLQRQVVGNFNEVRFICDPEWGIICSKNFKGVEPIYPRPYKSIDTVKVASLRPTLEWTPSVNPDVTYDLAILDELNFMVNYAYVIRTSGRIIFYKENISTPHYKLDQPLKSNSDYYWSVRLRNGNKVSNWSTQSYFWTVILWTGMGLNNWFTFGTLSSAELSEGDLKKRP